ncbi:hypothetical protein MKX01_023274 [Papaver californicum]|nr:hypothetical protein MKX01_023274 [Papaver californicum]
MEINSFSLSSILILVLAFTTVKIAVGGDPDIITDFTPPVNESVVNPDFFTPSPTFRVLKASMSEFPGLLGQSVSYVIMGYMLLEFPVGSVNPPHTHPRSSELWFLISGTLEVGFVDTTNKLFTQTFQSGDLFVFPNNGILFRSNRCIWQCKCWYFDFHHGIPDGILAKSLKTDVATIQAIKAGLAPKP